MPLISQELIDKAKRAAQYAKTEDAFAILEAEFGTASDEQEAVEDIFGAMLTGNTESGITVTYQDVDGTVDFELDSEITTFFANTDITGAEAETLTDGSNADSLHDHSAASISLAVDDLTDAVITTPADDEVLAYDSGSGNFINQTPDEANLVDLDGSQTITNKTIDADNNTLSNLAHGAEVDDPSSGVHGVTGSVVGTTDTQTLTSKTIALSGNTISGAKTDFNTALSDGNFAYDGGAHHDGFSDFVAAEHRAWENSIAQNVHADNITEASVTQHQAALSITESQITDLDHSVDVVSNVATSRILGRVTAGSGDSEELTATQVRTLINVEDGAEANDVDSVNSQTGAVVLDADDISDSATTNKFATQAQLDKVDHLTVTQAVDLDNIESRVNALDASVILMGTWDASAGTFPGSGSAQAGESWIVSTGGTVDSVEFTANDRIVAITDNASTTTYASNWHKLDYTDAVLSVAGKTGAVTLAAGDITSDTFADARISESSVTQHEGALTITESQISDLDHSVDVVSNVATSRILGRTTAGTGDSEELTATQVRSLINVEDGADVTDTANVTSAGALMDSEVTNLAQVKAFDSSDYATAAQGTLADSAVQPGDNVSGLTNDAGYITATLTNEEVQDIVGAMVAGNTETGIAVTYRDIDGTIDFVLDSEITNFFGATDITGAQAETLTDGSNADALHTHSGSTTEEIQDIVGAMFTGNTETLIAATYQDGDGTIDLVVDEASIDHGSIAGLSDDDHTQYLLVDGSRAMTGDLTVNSNTFELDPTSGDTLVRIATGGALSNEGDWRLQLVASTGQLRLSTFSDAGAYGENALEIDRTGTTVDTVNFPNGELQYKGNEIATTNQLSNNLIINGDFNIWQRGTSFTGPVANDYCADRWRFFDGNGSADVDRVAFTAGQTDVPGEPQYFLRYDLTSSSSSGDTGIEQRIEDVRTAAGQELTISMYLRVVSGTQDITPHVSQVFGSGGSSTVDTAKATAWTLTTDWQLFTWTLTVPSISGKTIGSGSFLRFYTDGGNGVTFKMDVARAKAEMGSIATPFTGRPIGQEIALCQRYHEKSYDVDVYPGTVTDEGQIKYVFGFSGTFLEVHTHFNTRKRAAPSIVIYSPGSGTSGQVEDNANVDRAGSVDDISASGFNVSKADGTNRGFSFQYEADAEL